MSIGNNTDGFSHLQNRRRRRALDHRVQEPHRQCLLRLFRILDAQSAALPQRFGQRCISRYPHHRWHHLAIHRVQYAAGALPGEASFSASGHLHHNQGGRNAWIATGGSTIARILATRDGGDTWNAYDTPLVSSPSAGAISAAFRDPWNGIVGGGDLASNTSADAATSNDGGRTWTLTTPPPIPGAIFCLSYVGGVRHHDDRHIDDAEDFDDEHDRTVVITTETEPNFDSGAAAWTPDEGRTWFALPSASGYWAVAFASPKAGWFVGNNGQILKISF